MTYPLIFDISKKLKIGGGYCAHAHYLKEGVRLPRVGIQKAKSNSCSIGFTKLMCTVASENYRFGPFDKEIQ
jgi:hypothetical protein